MDSVGFFELIGQCSLDEFLETLAYRHSAEIDWKYVRCVRWFPYKCKTDDVSSIPEQQLPGKKRNREGVLVTEKLSL